MGPLRDTRLPGLRLSSRHYRVSWTILSLVHMLTVHLVMLSLATEGRPASLHIMERVGWEGVVNLAKLRRPTGDSNSQGSFVSSKG